MILILPRSFIIQGSFEMVNGDLSVRRILFKKKISVFEYLVLWSHCDHIMYGICYPFPVVTFFVFLPGLSVGE